MYIHILCVCCLSPTLCTVKSSLLKGMTSRYLPDKTPNRFLAWSNHAAKLAWQVVFLPTRRMFATSQTLEHYGRAWHSLLLTLGICLTNLLERDIPFLWILEISGNFGLVTSESWGNQLPPNKDVFSWRSSGSRNLRWNSEMARTSARSWSNLIKFNQIHTSCGFTLPWLQLSPPFGEVEKNVDRRIS